MTKYQSFSDAELLSSEYSIIDALEIMLRRDGMEDQWVSKYKDLASRCFQSQEYPAEILFSSYVQAMSVYHVINNSNSK